jgi:hypothetical protein
MSTTRPVARKHHYIPQCYLRGFVRYSEKPKLAVIDMGRGKTFSASPENVAAERDFHAISVKGLPTDALEQEFSKFEAELAPAINRIVNVRAVKDRNDLNCILNFIALLAVKNPYRRAQNEEIAKDMVRHAAELAVADETVWKDHLRQAQIGGKLADISPQDYRSLHDFVARGDYDLQMAREWHLGVELNALKKMVRILAARRWSTLLAPPKSKGFITSDHPVCLTWSDEPPHTFYPPGHALTGTSVLFPLHKHLALLGSFEGPSHSFELGADKVAVVNGEIIRHANKQIYGQVFDFEYQFAKTDKVRQGRELLNDRLVLNGRTHRR